MSSPREAFSVDAPPPRAGKNAVIQDLARFGPSGSNEAMTLHSARQYCKSLAKSHYENFSVASLLLPAAMRQDFYNIYAYCRWSDDLADEVGAAEKSLELLAWWRSELQQCFHGTARHPVLVALENTIAKHSLPIEPFEKLLDAFVHDQTVHRYKSHLEVMEYCRGSANPVGRILLKLARVVDSGAEQLSDRICTGLQIANFCQDIKQDAERNRIYLPKDLWHRFQLTENEILGGKCTENLAYALKVWCGLARTSLISGLPLVKQTPRWLARDIQLFARGGLTLLDNIAKANFNVWNAPIEVTKKQKLTLLLRATLFPRSLQVAELRMPRGSV